MTSLVLYPGTREDLRVRWTLLADDFVSYGAGFPGDGGRPEPVLRLRRVCPGAGLETVRELPLRLEGIGGGGDAGFQLEGEYAQFEAELGLSNDEGGWLLLARSNRLQHAAGIGLESLRSGAFLANRLERRSSGDALRSIEVGKGEARAVSSLASSGAGGSSSVPVEAYPGASGAGLDEVLPLGAGALDTGESLHPARSEEGQSAVFGSGADAQRSFGENATPDAVPAPMLVYGKPSPMEGAALHVEAELHIRGWAPPNSEIDLYGHRYRVGPGGGFQLVLKIDDPDLLGRALALHLPSELIRQRDP